MPTFFEDIKSYVGFSEDDSEILRELESRFEPLLPAIIDSFYDKVLAHPKAKAALLRGPKKVDQLKVTLREWLRSGLKGPHDESFYERRARIGRRHVEVDLPQQYMVTAMNIVRIAFRERIEEMFADEMAKRRRVMNAADRLFDLELAIMLQTYREDSDLRLREQEQKAAHARFSVRLRTLVDTVQALLLELDEAGRVVVVNVAAAEAVGTRVLDELKGVVWFEEFVLAEDVERVGAVLQSVAEGRRTTASIECRLRLGERGERHFSWTFSRLEDEDGRVRVFASGLDTTELKALERRTRVSEKLAAVGTLSAGLAHEIRNPLNAVNLQLKLLERRLAQVNADEGLLEPGRRVQDEVNRLARLLREFLMFARPGYLSTQEVDLSELVRHVAKLEQPVAAQASVSLELDLPDDPVLLQADSEKLQQIIVNLLNNALDAVGSGGQVVLAVRPEEDGVHLVVSDDGPGIDAQQISRVFEPFFSTKSGGTGLGMAIVHSLVSLHGGRIDLESKDGLTVDVWFPLDGAGEVGGAGP